MTERHVYTEDLKDQRLYEGYKEEIHTTYWSHQLNSQAIISNSEQPRLSEVTLAQDTTVSSVFGPPK